MLRWLTRPNPVTATALQLYGSSVAQARSVAFYRDWCVADTMDGRFELVMLHVGLLMRRLNGEPKGKELARLLAERMFMSLDDDLREIGVGDLTVPKRIQAAASAFYGRLKVYDAALNGTDDQILATALTRNFPEGTRPLDAARLATYMRAVAADLTGQPFDRLERGEATFLDPETLKS